MKCDIEFFKSKDKSKMGFPDEVYVTLSSNVEMVNFLNVEQYVGETPYDPMIAINELTNFFNFTLSLGVKTYTENQLKKEECAYLPSFYKMLYHKVKFIESEIYDVRAKHREKMRDFTEFIIDFLQKWPPTDDNMIISVKTEELKKYLVKDPVEVSRLIKKHDFYVSLINSVNNCFTTKTQVEDELKIVLETISQTIDERTSFFPIHALQTKFERLFMSPLLPYSSKFEEVVASYSILDSQLFLKTLFNVIPPFLNDLGINRKPYDSALVLLLIRFLFDSIYEQNKLINVDGEDLLHDLVNTTFAQLKPPAEFSPQVEDKDTRIIDVFAYDEHFGVAVPSLLDMLFCTNPFDILDCVDKALFAIEKAATVYNNYQTMVFPFEVTFELFMAVAIAAQVGNWANMSVFVENYTPLTGLCPSFEFSKAKVVASAMQFQVMVAEMKGEHPSDEMDDKAKKAAQYAASYSENIGDIISNGIVTLPEISQKTQEEEEEKVENEVDQNNNGVQNENNVEESEHENKNNDEKNELVTEKNDEKNENVTENENNDEKNENENGQDVKENEKVENNDNHDETVNNDNAVNDKNEGDVNETENNQETPQPE